MAFQTVENMLTFEDIWRGFHNLLLLLIPEAEHLTFLGVNIIMTHTENAVLSYHLLNYIIPSTHCMNKRAKRITSPESQY